MDYYVKFHCRTKEQAELLLNGDLKVGRSYSMYKFDDCNIEHKIYRSFSDILELELTDRDVIVQIKDLSNFTASKPNLKRENEQGNNDIETISNKPVSKSKQKEISEDINLAQTRVNKRKESIKAKAEVEVAKPKISINKFLELHPEIRTLDELGKYYDKKVIKKAIINGVFYEKRGKIYF